MNMKTTVTVTTNKVQPRNTLLSNYPQHLFLNVAKGLPALLFFFTLNVYGDDHDGHQHHNTPTEIAPVVIDNGTAPQHSLDALSTFKTENVAPQKLKDSSRQTLSEVLRDQVGVDSQVFCANCGAKRLTINGLKGEHTSLLVDGLPLHSAVSSFYGIDNVPVVSLSDIQVMRGAGASLTNPEAIGGTLNLITVNPLAGESRVSSSITVDDSLYGKAQNHSLLYTLRDQGKKWGVSFAGQYLESQPWDEDQNRVSESPYREGGSAMIKGRFRSGGKNDFMVRHSRSQLEILGGYHKPTRPTTVRPLAAQQSDFVDGDVEKTYQGAPATITDWVRIDRHETALHGKHLLSENLTWKWQMGHARQQQKTIYQHGFDYANIDHLIVAETDLTHSLNESHLLRAGLFIKDQRLRSASDALFESYPANDPRDIPKDNFNFRSNAVYLQHSYFYGETLQVDTAVRADQVKVLWQELDNQVARSILAPRIQALHNFNEHLSQRLSYGRGYRAPLTYFESQHGNNEAGYKVAIDQLEEVDSLVYSISYNTPTGYITAGAHGTRLHNMAYGYESPNQPVHYRNSTESYNILVSDFLMGYKPVPQWFLEASIEFFQYETGYKQKLPTAALEKRIQWMSTWEGKNWLQKTTVQFIGSRDLSQYGGYSRHYRVRNQASEPILDTTLPLKKQKAPAYVVVDTQWTQKLKGWDFTFAIQNLFDYTQARTGDTPSNWHWHFNHAHFDGLQTWGPNQGRTYSLSIATDF